MLSGFCCFCFMLLYKVRKTFGYVFLGYCCRFPRTLLSFFSASAVFVLCFCTKTFRNLYKTEYFLYKKRREFQHVFSVFSGYILSGPRTFLLFSLTIANRKSCFWRSDRPQMAGFILVSRMFFMPFSDSLIDFLVSSCFFSCIFLSSTGKKSSVVLSSGSSVSEIFSLHRDIFLSSAEKFFHLIPVFSVLFLNSFRRKSLFFSASASRFRAFFPHLSNHFRAFSRAVWKIFLSVSIIFPLFSGLSGGKIHISRNGFSVRLLSLEGNSSTIPVFGGFRSVFFLPVLCRLLPCFFPVIPIFIRNLLRFTMLLAVFLSAIPVFWGSRSVFFCQSCAGARRVSFSHTGTFSPFLPFPLMENLLLSCFRVDFSHESDARAFARA